MLHSKLVKTSGIFRVDVTTKREYIVTQKFLKEKLEIKGNIKTYNYGKVEVQTI